MKHAFAASVLSAIVLSPALLSAQEQPVRRPVMEGERPVQQQLREGIDRQSVRANVFRMMMQNPEMMKSAGLNETQIAQLKEDAHAFRQSLVTLRSEEEIARNEVEKLQEDPKTDEAALMKAIEHQGAKQLAIRKAEAAFELKVRKMVGPEGIQKIRERTVEMMRNRMDTMRGQEAGPGGERPRAPWMQGRMEPPPAEGAAPAPPR